MRIYATVCSNASSGACSSRAIGSVSVTNITVAATAKAVNSTIPLPTTSPVSSSFFWPIYCPSRMVTPMDRLEMVSVTH